MAFTLGALGNLLVLVLAWPWKAYPIVRASAHRRHSSTQSGWPFQYILGTIALQLALVGVR